MQSGLSFQFGKLRQDAQNRWLKNSEVLFILKNHENLPIEEETPEKPTSGSLFLFDRRILKYFRKDGHMWRKKKDGRAVGEAHERLKVGNVDALSCYYAHGEENRYFQRRIYWMLDHAYAHIVLVHYLEVSKGKFLPPTDSQQTEKQLSSRNGNSSANNIQFERVPSATSEMYDSYDTFCSPISGEANSLHVGKDVDTNWPNMFNISANSAPSLQQEGNQALRDLEEQLSLDKYDDNVPVDILPVHTDEHENLEDSALLDGEIRNSFQKLQENLTPTIEYTGCDQGVNRKLKSHDRKISPSWNDMLECSSYLTELGAHGRAFNSMALAICSEPCTTNAAGAYHHGVGNEFKQGSGKFLPPTDSQQTQEQLSSRNGNSSANNIQFQRVPSETSVVYDSYETFCSPISGEANSLHVGKDIDTNLPNMFNISANSDPSSQQEVNQALRDLEEQLSLDKYDDNVPVDILPVHTDGHENLEDSALLDSEIRNSFQKLQEILTPTIEYTGCDQGINGKLKSHDRKISPSWTDMLECSSYLTELGAHGRAFNSMALANGSKPCTTSAAGAYHHGIGNGFKHGSQISSQNIFDAQFKQLEQISWQHPGHAGNYAEHMADGAGELYNAPGKSFDGRNSNPVSAQKENGIDYMGDIDIYDRNNAYSSDLLGMYSDQDQHGSSIAAEPCLTVPHTLLFRIREISPEWSFSFERTKVIITGDFLCIPSECSWAVMFGEVQVPAEIIQEGVLRCQAPEHSSGKVALCITSGNKESCSEVRQFEFRSKSVTSSLETSHLVNATKNSEELSLLVKFVYVLLCRSDDLSVAKGTDPRVTEYHRKLKAAEEQWFQSHEHQTELLPGTIDGILQELIKDKFQQWLLSKTNAKEDESSLLSNEDQRIIHMISGLGYEWALKPILDAGVGINFRDANGMTALHWAARFGREKMAAALLAVGAFAGAVTDPTPQDPVGKTAGDIAAARGHNGLAGYLSEAYMTEYLFSIKGLAVVEDGKIVESISEKSASVKVGETEDEISLKDSLAAVRNAAQAAARIQAAFRAHSFKKRQEKDAMKRDEYGMTSEEIHCLASSTKMQRTRNSFHGQKFDKAALSIQKKYKGWKARKDFLAFRQRVVKIQAHVRGHQARMKYQIFSTVSVLDKLILRWRRRGNGLRGFRLESDLADEGGEDIIKVFRKQKVDGTLEQAFSRVISTVKSPRSRQQYRRMLEYYCQVKAEEESAEEAIRVRDNFELMEDDEFLHWLQQDQF